MEKRISNILLSLSGMSGLIYAGISFMNDSSGIRNIRCTLFLGILGIIFFVAGLRLLKIQSIQKPGSCQ